MIIKHGCATLRAIEEKDFDLLFETINSPEIENQTGGWNLPVSTHEQKQWMLSHRNTEKSIRLMIELENGHTIGMVTLSNIDWKNRVAFIHYKVRNSLEGRIKGDMQDAVIGMLGYAFMELGMNCIEGSIMCSNTFSRKLAKKVGFTEDGILRQRIYKNGKYHDKVEISILRDEYISIHGRIR